MPEILVVYGENVPAKSLAELVALAKAQPGKIVFASTGLGGMPHLATELLKITAKIDLVHVPYTGAAPAVNDLLGGHVQMMFADIPVLLGAVQSGKLRALAIGSKTHAARSCPTCRPRPSWGCRMWRPTTGTGWWWRVRRRPIPSSPRLQGEAVEALQSARGEGEIPGPGRRSPSATPTTSSPPTSRARSTAGAR